MDSGQVCQSYPRRGRPPAQVLLFEQTDELAGVWASNYHKYAVQTPCRYYSFPDAPLSPDHDFTDGRMMKKYVKDYAHKHGVDQVAHLRSRVLEVEDLLEEATETAFARKWKLRVEHSSEDGVVTEMVYQVDQVAEPLDWGGGSSFLPQQHPLLPQEEIFFATRILVAGTISALLVYSVFYLDRVVGLRSPCKLCSKTGRRDPVYAEYPVPVFSAPNKTPQRC